MTYSHFTDRRVFIHFSLLECFTTNNVLKRVYNILVFLGINFRFILISVNDKSSDTCSLPYSILQCNNIKRLSRIYVLYRRQFKL
jgi:hypothetical protein